MGKSITWWESGDIQVAQGPLRDNYTATTTLLNTSDLRTYPADFWRIGRALRIDALGSLKNIVTTPGTVTFNLKLGSVVVFTTGAIQLNADVHAILPFWLEIMLTCRSVGSGTSATFMGQGKITGKMVTVTAGQVDGPNTHSVLMVPTSAPAVGTGFDSTAAQQLDLQAAFSIQATGTGVQLEQYVPTVVN